MDADNSRRGSFPSTQWSLVLRSGSEDANVRARALEELCQLYWTPVYAFVRSRGHAPHDAEDFTQGFFAKILEHNDLARVDENLGRLRSYLLAAVKNYLSGERRHATRLKRGGGTPTLSLDLMDAEARCLIPEAADQESPDRVFERQWAICLMENVVRELEERYTAKGQAALFREIRPYISTTETPAALATTAARLEMTEQALRVAVHRLRQRYGEIFRMTVKSTLLPGDNVEEEVAWLLTVFK